MTTVDRSLDSRIRRLAALCGLLASLLAPGARAASIVIDSDALTLTVDGVEVSALQGTPFSAGVSEEGVAEFFFAGDLTIGPDDSVKATGSRPISLLAANDATVLGLVSVDALGARPGPGGGWGGSAGSAGASGNGQLLLALAAGGSGGYGGTGAQDGFDGGRPPAPIILLDVPAGPGRAGSPGAPGAAGFAGGIGGAGGGGGALTPVFDLDISRNGRTYDGGSGAGYGRDKHGANGRDGDAGFFGFGGYSGDDAANGSPGANAGSGPLLSGGGGGGGGGGGSGGSGGMAGGIGGAGSGGGGGGGHIWIFNLVGGQGGSGGIGGQPGAGGAGGSGGSGGRGGHGGGAITIRAQGRMITAAQLFARGGHGNLAGSPGARAIRGLGGAGDTALRQPGEAGRTLGYFGGCFIECPGNGGNGGAGAAGGNGGWGGHGGRGGAGGSGAGGTLLLSASVLVGFAQGSVEGGAASYQVEAGGAGRVVLASNRSYFFDGIDGGTRELFPGPRGANPHLEDRGEVPLLPDALLGGADVAGLSDGVDPDLLAALRADAPEGAIAAVLRFDDLPTVANASVTPAAFPDFDGVLVVNLGDTALGNPSLGFFGMGGDAPDFRAPLRRGGWDKDPRFGGSGQVHVLETLEPGGVYATLVPNEALWINLAFDEGTVLGAPFEQAGDSVYLIADGSPGGDSDGDGVPDADDNCTLAANGPTRPDAGGNVQLDSDADGYGNLCDGDFNQDGFVGGPDFASLLACFGRATGPGGPGDDPRCEESDMNGDGFVGGPDFDAFLAVFDAAPGPAGVR